MYSTTCNLFKTLSNTIWQHCTLNTPLVTFIIICGLLSNSAGDIEPKLNYEDPTAATRPAILDADSISSSNTLNTASTKSSLPITDLGFIHAFIASISVILVSELGDKTFFIAAIMAMRHPRLTVFTGAMSALALMTILSAVFGMAATIIPRVYTYYISTALFAIFGLKMLKDGYYMSPTDAQEELEEVQSDLRKREDELMKSIKDGDDLANGTRLGSGTSIRICKNNNDDDDDDIINDDDEDNDNINQIKSMLPNNSGTTAGIISNSEISRRTQSTSNIIYPSIDDISAALNHKVNSVLNIQYSGDNIKDNSDKATKIINNGDIRTNDIEMQPIGTKKRLEREVSSTLVVQDAESGVVRKTNRRSAAYLASRVFMQAFTMTFLAEWGDRSQLTTIILSAREDVYGVIVGGVLGHSLCTGLAVIGGRMIAQKISVRTVTLVGGVVFILFAISALFFNPNDE